MSLCMPIRGSKCLFEVLRADKVGREHMELYMSVWGCACTSGVHAHAGLCTHVWGCAHSCRVLCTHRCLCMLI